LKTKTIIIEVAIAIICILAMWLAGGCSQTICNRTYIIIDPNGCVTIDQVHLGATSIATDTEIGKLTIESKGGEISLNRATRKEDSFKGIVPAVGAVQTNE
jgi:hypothetical protein